MLLLVNVEKHQEVLGKIVADLVKYGVPISLVAGANEVCARCSFVQGKAAAISSPSECISSSAVPHVSSQEQNTMNEVKMEPNEDHLTIVENGSDSLSSLATSTPTPVNEIDQAIKRALSITKTSLPVVVTLPLDFRPITFNNAISPNAVKLNNNDREQKLHYKVPSAIGLGSSTVRKFPDLQSLTSVASFEAKPMQNQQTSIESKPQDFLSKIHKKKKDRPLSYLVTKSGMVRKGRKTYTEKDLQILEEFYLRDPFACASPDKRQVLCHMLNIDAYRLKVWFQNRRRRDKVNFENQKIKEN